MSLVTQHIVSQGSKWKVRCMAMYYNLIFVGCSDSMLRIFAPFQRTKNKSSIEYQIIKQEKLRGKSIVQLEIVEYVDLLIVIIDDNCSFYSLYSPRELGNAFINQGKITFNCDKLFDCDDTFRGTVIVSCSKAWSDGLGKKLFIGFGKRKEISVFQWKGGVASNLKNTKASSVLKRYNSYPIPEKPRVLILAGRTMCVGYKEQYDLIHLETSSKQLIFSTGRAKQSIGIKLINKEILLVVDKSGYFVNYDGKPTRSSSTGTLEWSDQPLNIAYFHPYIISILPKYICIHHVLTSRLVYKIDFKYGKYITSSSYKTSSIWNTYISISSSTEIISFSLSLISLQLKYFLIEKNAFYEEALKLITLYETEQFEQEGLDKNIKKKEINQLYGYSLFNKSDFNRAVHKFIESGIGVRRIISLFPTLVPAGQCTRAMNKHPVNYQNVSDSISTFKLSISSFLIPYLDQIKLQINNILNNNNNNNDDDLKDNTGNNDITDLLSQFENPDEYDSDNEWNLLVLIDTVYIKCLLHTNESGLKSFLLLNKNYCDIHECKLLLQQHKKFEELVLLYKSHNLHKNALKLLQVKHLELNGIQKTISYLQELGSNEKNEKLILHFSEWVFREDPNEALRIFTGKEFGQTNNINDNVAANYDNDNQDDLTLNLPKIEAIKIVDHLDRIKTPIPTRIAYLEMIIFEGGEISSIFHDDLIKLYLQEIFTAYDEELRENTKSREEYGLARGDIVELTSDFSLGKYGWVETGTYALVSSVVPTPNHSIQVHVTFPQTGTFAVVPKQQLKKTNRKRRIRPEQQEGRVGILRRKLINFLKKSSYFKPSSIKNLFPKNYLLEEQAWLRSKIPQHRDALIIIVYDLEDPQMAEEYCNTIYNQYIKKLSDYKDYLIKQQASSASASKDLNSSSNKINILAKNQILNDPKWIEAEKIYLTLLDVYLNPPSKYKIVNNNKFISAALKMLSDNHKKINPILVFNKLPDSMKVQDCLSYMEAVFKNCFEKKREYQVKKNLLKQASLKLTLRKNLRQQSFQIIKDDTKCNKCNKIIGRSAFVRYPNGNVFHYVCVQSNQTKLNPFGMLNDMNDDYDDDDNDYNNTIDID